MALDPRDLEWIEQRKKDEVFEYSTKIELANCIVDAIKDEFKHAHLSGNLVKTIKISVKNRGWGKTDVFIEIPARKYNVKHFKETGVIKYYNRGSYANIINDFGEHRGWVERCIKKGMSKWLAQEGRQGRISFNE